MPWHITSFIHVPDAAAMKANAGEHLSEPSSCMLQAGKLRMDAFLARRLPKTSRSRLKDCIRDGKVHVNSAQQTKAAHALRLGDAVTCQLPEPRVSSAAPQNIPLDIVHEDGSVIVVNKPAGTCTPLSCTFPPLHTSQLGMQTQFDCAAAEYRMLLHRSRLAGPRPNRGRKRHAAQAWWCTRPRGMRAER